MLLLLLLYSWVETRGGKVLTFASKELFASRGSTSISSSLILRKGTLIFLYREKRVKINFVPPQEPK